MVVAADGVADRIDACSEYSGIHPQVRLAAYGSYDASEACSYEGAPDGFERYVTVVRRVRENYRYEFIDRFGSDEFMLFEVSSIVELSTDVCVDADRCIKKVHAGWMRLEDVTYAVCPSRASCSVWIVSPARILRFISCKATMKSDSAHPSGVFSLGSSVFE